MATTIVTKNGSGAPTASDLVAGELAVDLTNGRLYTEDSGGSVIEIGLNPSGNVDITGTATMDGLRVDGTPVRFVSTAPMLNFMESGVTDSNHRLRQNAGNFVIQKLSDDEGTATDRLFIDGGTGNVGIGTSSPDDALVVRGNIASPHRIAISNENASGKEALKFSQGTTTKSWIEFDNSTSNFDVWQYTSNPLRFGTSNTERMRIDASGNVGIGTSSPDSGYKLDVAGNVVFGDGGGFDMNVDGTRWQFSLGGSEKMRLDASGNLLLGKTSDAINVAGVVNYNAGIVRASRNGNSGQFGRISTDGDIVTFYKDTLTVGSIGVATGPVAYMVFNDTTSDNVAALKGGSGKILPSTKAGADKDGTMSLGSSTARFKDLYLSSKVHLQYPGNSYYGRVEIDSSTNLIFGAGPNGSEGFRLDSSGNLLVGKTVTSLLTAGIALNSNGSIYATADAERPLILNRETSDGSIAEFRKDNSVVGSIGSRSAGANLYIAFRTETTGDGCGLTGSAASDGAIIPSDGNGAAIDDHIDLGASGTRFDDIYATSGTVNSSDGNEKQDIEELSDAEQRVAVACKGLLRKFRWKSRVAEKGDDARIHFGIIAQDLQAAFEAEGLDAGRYGMFINGTWTDEETGEERSRMGVRYSELLAFIIAAI
jgi:hypothetical protein